MRPIYLGKNTEFTFRSRFWKGYSLRVIVRWWKEVWLWPERSDARGGWMWLITQWGNWAGRGSRCFCGCIWFISVWLYLTQCSFLCWPSASYERNHAPGNLKFVLLKLCLNVSIVLEQTLTLKTEITAFKFMVIGCGEWIELAGFLLPSMFLAKESNSFAEKESDGQENPKIYRGLPQAH